jgi:formylglycine-generating enzyme required for sulfatase activity
MNESPVLEMDSFLKVDGGGQKYRMLRGGSWNLSPPEIPLSSFRFRGDSNGRNNNRGFRCVLGSSRANEEDSKSVEAKAETDKIAEEQARLAREAAKAEAGKADVSKKATKESPYENCLGMKFVPVPGTHVLFSVWDTRVKDYSLFVTATNYGADRSTSPFFSQTNDDPVVSVSWNDAKAFCKWLTTKERGEGKLGKDQEYRLPTDAEWSVAVGLPPETGETPGQKNGKVKGVYPWGTQWPPPKGTGNYHPSLGVDSFEKTSPVGSFPANRFGLYDMGGNVWQWCEDSIPPSGYRVVRGGSWRDREPSELLSSFRLNDLADFRIGWHYGFRCVLGSSR